MSVPGTTASCEATILDEEALALDAKAGDAEAFAEIFRCFYAMVFALAYRLSLNRADAQDIAQETFIKASRAIRDYEPEGVLKNWLYRICANTARDWQRRSRRRGEMEDAVRIERDAAGSEREGDYDEAMVALGGLTAELRAAVVLIYFEEMSHGEAARVLGCAEATVSWRIFQAKRKLKKALTR